VKTFEEITFGAHSKVSGGQVLDSKQGCKGFAAGYLAGAGLAVWAGVRRFDRMLSMISALVHKMDGCKAPVSHERRALRQL